MTEADQYKLQKYQELAARREGIQDLLALWAASEDPEEKADIWAELGECSMDWASPEVRVPLLKWMYTFRKTVLAYGSVWVKPHVYAEDGYGSLSWEKLSVEYRPGAGEELGEGSFPGFYVLLDGELEPLYDIRTLVEVYAARHHRERRRDERVRRRLVWRLHPRFSEDGIGICPMNRPDLHPTTLALLQAARNTAGPLGDLIDAWRAAGCPDLPVPRYVPTEPGWYWREPASGRTISQVWRSDNDGALRWGPNCRVEPDDVVDPCWLGPVEPWREPAERGAPKPARTAEEKSRTPSRIRPWKE